MLRPAPAESDGAHPYPVPGAHLADAVTTPAAAWPWRGGEVGANLPEEVEQRRGADAPGGPGGDLEGPDR